MKKQSSDKQNHTTPQGDDMKDWMWDGPEDSDEEIEDMIPLKNK